MSFLDLFFKKDKKSRGRRRASGHRYSKLSLSTTDIRKIQDGWARVDELITVGQPSQLRQAVIKADNLLDFALQRLTTGAVMGERLKNAREYFKDYAVYQGLWQAHKVRNALVHEADYEPTHHVSKEAIGKIKRGLGVLGARLE